MPRTCGTQKQLTGAAQLALRGCGRTSPTGGGGVGDSVLICGSCLPGLAASQPTAQVVAITAGGDPNCNSAEFTPDTNITFESGQPFLKIKGQNSIQRLFKRDFDIAELGIGGLDRQFGEIFRGAFASRAAPPHIAKAMNIQHTKGILLYGPPGTGALRALRPPHAPQVPTPFLRFFS